MKGNLKQLALLLQQKLELNKRRDGGGNNRKQNVLCKTLYQCQHILSQIRTNFNCTRYFVHVDATCAINFSLIHGKIIVWKHKARGASDEDDDDETEAK